MVKNLSIRKIEIVLLSSSRNNANNLFVGINFKDLEACSDRFQCNLKFLDFLDSQGYKISIDSFQTKSIEGFQCFVVYGLDGYYIALADLSLTKFFLLDSGTICSKEELMQAAKARRRQQLYDSLASHLNQAIEAKKQLEELEEISLNFQKK